MLRLTVTDEPDTIADISKKISGKATEFGEGFITFCCDDSNSENLVCQLAQELVYIIETKYKKPLIKLAARAHGRFFSDEETEMIAEYTKNFGVQLLSSEIEEYLRQNDNVSLRGLVNFRLKQYKAALLRESITVADGMENIKLLREYISMMPPSGKVNVIMKESGGITIRDEDGRDITGNCITDIGSDAIPEYFSFEELLLSALIVRAPSEIILHQKKKIGRMGFAGILSEIFPGRIVICSDCNMCKNC